VVSATHWVAAVDVVVEDLDELSDDAIAAEGR